MTTKAHDDVLAGFGEMSTPTVSDALDRLAINGQASGIRPLDPRLRIVGRAFTLSYLPVGVTGGTVGDYIDDVAPGSVLVLDNAGRLDATVWGDILTLVASRRKMAGTVIDGICRDTARARELGYPIYARGSWMRTGKDRVKLAAIQVPVVIGGVLVSPGDLLLGDADGIVVIPSRREDEVLEVARAIEDAEDAIRAAVLAGSRLDDARRLRGYHSLQTHSGNGTRDRQGER
jgi:4-hydroxy-4-methyl-2-oxoglutarate aldolase